MKLLLSLTIIVLLIGCASAPPTEPVLEPKVAVAPEPVPEPAPPVAEPDKPFEVTEELYTKTFDQIDAVIAKLNMTIQKKDYDTWISFLTEGYIEETSNLAYLQKFKDNPNLKHKNVVLKGLPDYFNYLVVPSRANVKLDEIEFVDDSRVYAFTVIEGQKYLLYYLVQTDDGWKVDFY